MANARKSIGIGTVSCGTAARSMSLDNEASAYVRPAMAVETLQAMGLQHVAPWLSFGPSEW